MCEASSCPVWISRVVWKTRDSEDDIQQTPRINRVSTVIAQRQPPLAVPRPRRPRVRAVSNLFFVAGVWYYL